MFWTEEVENELGRWEEEKQTLAEVETRGRAESWPPLTPLLSSSDQIQAGAGPQPDQQAGQGGGQMPETEGGEDRTGQGGGPGGGESGQGAEQCQDMANEN